jgi:hypothetical protein
MQSSSACLAWKFVSDRRDYRELTQAKARAQSRAYYVSRDGVKVFAQHGEPR